MSEDLNKIIIGLDMDGVIIDHTDLKIELAKKFGFKLLPEQTQSEQMKDFMPADAVKKIKEYLYNDPEIALLPKLMPDAKAALDEFKKRNTSYFLVSRRKDPNIAIELLEAHGLWPDYFSDQNAFFVDEPEDKDIEAVKLGITHFVDDEIKVLEKLPSVKNRILFDKHNSWHNVNDYHRVNSWQEVLNYLFNR